MDLYAPQAAASVPVVLFIHGGSLAEAGERRDSSMYAPVCPGLAARGILCATMDYRLAQLEQSFARDAEDRRVYGSLAWRLRANPTAWVSPQAPPFLVLVAESERFMPAVLEEGARFVRLMRELERPADLRILAGRRHVTTTTGFADPNDVVANLVAAFVRNPKGVTTTP